MVTELMKVPLLSTTTVECLRVLGINSLEDLALLSDEACAMIADRLKSISSRLAKDGYLKERLIMACRYAKAIKRGKPLLFGYNPLLNSLAISYRRKRLIFFDLEYDPEKPFIFIIGIMDVDGRVSQFFIEDNEEERRALLRLTNIITDKVLVCYAGKSADIPTLQKCYKKYNFRVPRLELIDLFYDILFTGNIRKQTIYLPLTCLSEKTVANYLGYKPPRNLEIKDGLSALLHFYAYLREKDPSRKIEIRDQLLLYNYSDLERSKFILERIFKLFKVM